MVVWFLVCTTASAMEGEDASRAVWSILLQQLTCTSHDCENCFPGEKRSGYNVSGTCVPLPCPAWEMCTECVDGACKACSTYRHSKLMGYIVDAGKCKYCMVSNATSTSVKDAIVCDACPSGSYEGDDGECISCADRNCERCTSDGCVSCAHPYAALNGTCVPCTLENCKKCASDGARKCDECVGGNSNGTCLPSARLDVAEVWLIVAGGVALLLCVGVYCCHLVSKQKRSAFTKDKQRNAADSAPPGEDYPVGIPVPEASNVPYATSVP